MFKYSLDNKRYHTLNYFYKMKFNSKVMKISLNGNFTCPNIDGYKGLGGCIYCSKTGSGEFGGDANDDLITQFYKIKSVMDNKWDGLYIAYFQARSNTYAPVSELRDKFEPILKLENVVGLSLATRCDAISEECLEYLDELNKKTYLTVELGLQTIHPTTSKLINRCHSLEEFDNMVKLLRQRNINVVVHIINGLPYETKDMMLSTAKHLNNLDIQGVKFHMLSILKDTPLEKYYKNNPFHILSKEEYVDIVVEQLEVLDESIVIHRVTSDPDKNELIEPKWLVKKLCVLNDIDKLMVKRDTYQGKKVK